MKQTLRGLAAPALLASLTLASGLALADTVTVAEISMNTKWPVGIALKLPAGGVASGGDPNNYNVGSYWVGSQNISVTTPGSGTTSFLAFCVDPFQYSTAQGQDYSASYGLSALVSQFNANLAGSVANLYSQSYASTSGSELNSAAFQLALWELIKPAPPSLTTANTPTAVSDLASSMVTAAQSNTGGTQYSYTLYTNGTYQDYLVATPIAAVPEPETYALLLSGLGLIGVIARRRKGLAATV